MRILCRLIVVVCCMIFLQGLSPLYAQRAGTMNLERMVREAGMIFSGEVIDVETGERDEAMNLFVTHYTFRIHDRLYGIENDTVTIKQYGGEAGGKSFYPKGVPRFTKGEKVLVFFYPPSKIGMSSPVGMEQGKFTIRTAEKANGKLIANKQENENLFRGIRNTDSIVNPQWLKSRKPGELNYSEFALTVRNLVGQLKN